MKLTKERKGYLKELAGDIKNGQDFELSMGVLHNLVELEKGASKRVSSPKSH